MMKTNKNNYKDPLERKRTTARELRLIIKDFGVYLIYLIARWSLIFKRNKKIVASKILFRSDGLGDHIISLSNMLNFNIGQNDVFIYNEKWAQAVECLKANSIFSCYPVSKKNIYNYFLAVGKISAENSICLNSTPDIFEVLTNFCVSKNSSISLSSFANISYTFIIFQKIMGVRLSIIDVKSEHDFQCNLLNSYFIKNEHKNKFAASNHTQNNVVAIMAESSDTRKDLEVNSLIKYAKIEYSKASRFLILGLNNNPPITIDDARIYDLRGKTNLKDVICHIIDSTVYVGVDTGIMHIANHLRLELRVFIGGMHGSWFYPLPSPKVQIFTNICDNSPCNYSCVYNKILNNNLKFKCIPEINYSGETKEEKGKFYE